MAVMCGHFFDAKYLSVNYAVVSCQIIVASTVCPMLLAALQEASVSYQLAFQVFLGIAMCAFALSFAVNKPKEA